jgi:hypothetical protein
LTISLPFSSYFTSKCNLNGVGSLDCADIGGVTDIQSAIIYACTATTIGIYTGTNDRAIVEYRPTKYTYRMDVVFTYQILSNPNPPPAP